MSHFWTKMVPVLKSCSNLSLSLLRVRFQQKAQDLPSHQGKHFKCCAFLAQQLLTHLLCVRPEGTGKVWFQSLTTAELKSFWTCDLPFSPYPCPPPPPRPQSLAFPEHSTRSYHAPDISQWPKVNTNSFINKENVRNSFCSEQIV